MYRKLFFSTFGAVDIDQLTSTGKNIYGILRGENTSSVMSTLYLLMKISCRYYDGKKLLNFN